MSNPEFPAGSSYEPQTYTEELGIHLRGAAQTLFDNGKEDQTATEIIRCPFGRFSEGYIALRLADWDGFGWGGHISYRDKTKTDEQFTVRIKHSIIRNSNGGEIPVRTIARYLDRAFPVGEDNGNFRELIEQRDLSLTALASTIRQYIIPLAKHVRTDKVFLYRDPKIERLGTLDDESVIEEISEQSVVVDDTYYQLNDRSTAAIKIKSLDGSVHKTTLFTSTPYEIDGLETDIINRVDVDDIGKTYMECYMTNADGKRIIIPVTNPEALSQELMSIIDRIVEEKLYLATS